MGYIGRAGIMKSKHICKFFNTEKMVDVTTRNNNKSIHCRRCGDILPEGVIEKETLKKIKEKREQYDKTQPKKKKI